MKKYLFVITVFVILGGCQGQPRYGGGLHSDEGDRSISDRVVRDQAASEYAVDPIELGRVIDRYLGRPYAGTEENRRGYDCSEFVGEVFQEYASIHLPRTTENLFKTGRKVDPGNLYFGDLVFFDTGGRGVSHVGIYVGYGEFVHASSSNGIIISSLHEKYYKKRYLGARRVME